MKNILFISLLFLASVTTAQPVEGFGSQATGGAGFPTMNVTNLNASGAGSLAALIGSNRIIRFNVTGIINNFRATLTNISNLSIDASGLPAPGITLDNQNNGDCISLENCRNIIIKNIRVRNAGNDGINVIDNCQNIVLDHVSSRLNRDGNIDITTGANNVTVQYCLIGPGNTSDWSGGMLIAYTPTRNVSIHHNLFYTITANQVGERNPNVHSSNGSPGNNLMADIRNNVIYLWGRNNGTGSGYGTAIDYQATANVALNYYYSRASVNDAAVAGSYSNPAGSMYAAQNFSGNGINANSDNNHAQYAVPAFAQVQTQDPCTAANIVKNQAGTRPLDAYDQAIINQVNLLLCPIVTPVMWLSFHYNAYRNSLEWTTASEQNSNYFEVQESTDGINFYTVAKIPSKAPGGNSDTILNYEYVL